MTKTEVPFHFCWRGTVLKREKVCNCFVQDCTYMNINQQKAICDLLIILETCLSGLLSGFSIMGHRYMAFALREWGWKKRLKLRMDMHAYKKEVVVGKKWQVWTSTHKKCMYKYVFFASFPLFELSQTYFRPHAVVVYKSTEDISLKRSTHTIHCFLFFVRKCRVLGWFSDWNINPLMPGGSKKVTHS